MKQNCGLKIDTNHNAHVHELIFFRFDMILRVDSFSVDTFTIKLLCMTLVAEKVELTHSTIILRKDGMLELYTYDNHVYEIEHVKENVEVFGNLTDHRGAPVIIIGGSHTSTTPEARKYMASAESLKYSWCEAFVLTSLAQKILISIYIRIDKPLVPTKVFRDKDAAAYWCLQYLKKT